MMKHLRGYVGMFLFMVVLHGTQAFPSDMTGGDTLTSLSSSKGKNMDAFSECLQEHIERVSPVKYVSLTDTQTFSIVPSESLMYVRIMIDQTLYKVNVMGTMIKLFKCESGADQSCNLINENSSKGGQLLLEYQRNTVVVSFIQNKLTVGINLEENVMSEDLDTEGEDPQSRVAFVALDPTDKIQGPDHYTVNITVHCNETHIPMIETANPLVLPTPDPVDLAPAPFQTCPIYQVETEHPLPYVTLEGSLTLSVFPSESLLYMWILVEDVLYKATVQGSLLKLMECEDDNDSCDTLKDESTKNKDLLVPGRWNHLVITLLNDTITVDVNGQLRVMTMTMPAGEDGKQSQTGLISIVASEPNASQQPQTYYNVAVNIMCNDTFTPTITDKFPFVVTNPPAAKATTLNPLATSEPIFGNTTETPETSPSYVWIIVVVLVALVVLVAVGVALSSYKKKRTAQINQHTPLSGQEQQIQ